MFIALLGVLFYSPPLFGVSLLKTIQVSSRIRIARRKKKKERKMDIKPAGLCRQYCCVCLLFFCLFCLFSLCSPQKNRKKGEEGGEGYTDTRTVGFVGDKKKKKTHWEGKGKREKK